MTTRYRKGYIEAPTGQVHYRSLGPSPGPSDPERSLASSLPEGEGEPIVLLHMAPCSSLMFEAVYPVFVEAGYRATRLLDPRLVALRQPEGDSSLAVARSPRQRTPTITAIRIENDSKVSDEVIRSYIRQGKLKAFRVAGKRKVLIPRDELLKLLEPARGDMLDGEEDATKGNTNNVPPRGFMGGK